ncbi:MAG: hypothetical protein AAGA48_38275 [Myxococcota bacterium]
MYQSFPLLLLPILVYNFIAFYGQIPGIPLDEVWCEKAFGTGVHAVCCQLEDALIRIPMIARFPDGAGSIGVRAIWPISASDLLLGFGLIMLFFELLKSTQTQRASLVNHGLSLLVFVAGLIEFLLLPQFATSTFFFLMLMALLDTLAGFIVTVATARRDVSLGDAL